MGRDILFKLCKLLSHGQPWCSVAVLPLRIFRKPSLTHPFALLEDLEDAPQARKTGDAEDGTPEEVGNQQGSRQKKDAGEEEHPPAAGAEIILPLDDDGMEQTDDKESAKPQQGAFEIE